MNNLRSSVVRGAASVRTGVRLILSSSLYGSTSLNAFRQIGLPYLRFTHGRVLQRRRRLEDKRDWGDCSLFIHMGPDYQLTGSRPYSSGEICFVAAMRLSFATPVNMQHWKFILC